MCGMAGLYLPRGQASVEADINAMLASISHRGPDGRGCWTSPDRRFQCGFVRLAIIDLATGDQPIVGADGRSVLMGNGEIYNYSELRALPQTAGYPWRTQGDMEPVLPLYAAEGTAFVHRLNGMYGLALFDGDSLVLVRDRLGIKPLYWCRVAGGGILFASEIKALFASGLVTAEIDETAVANFLSHGYVPSPATIYRGVSKLPPGHLLRAGPDGSVVVERYWRPSPAAGFPTSAVEIREHLTELLDDSVRLQLRSDVPLGALLSGGVDSGLIVALAARQIDRPLNTYTVRFEGASVDEAPLAALVAQRYGTRHTVFDLSMNDVGNHLPRLAWHCDEPLSDASLLPNQLIEDVLGREVRVALNGTGGDELFAGYGRYFQLPIEKRWMRLPPRVRQLGKAAAGLFDPMTAWRLARGEKFDGDRGGYLHDHSTLFPPPIRKMLGGGLAAVEPAQRQYFQQFSGFADTGALYADICTYLPEDLLTLLDCTTMAASVEGRVPFLDHRLVEAALAVPPVIRTPAGRQKALERAMAEPFLPTEVLSARKQGFASPVAAWMRSGLGKTAVRLLTGPAALERGWWSAEGVARLQADPRHAPRLYTLMMLELTIRLHVEGASAAAGLEELSHVGH